MSTFKAYNFFFLGGGGGRGGNIPPFFVSEGYLINLQWNM